MPSRFAIIALALCSLSALGQAPQGAPAGTVDNPMHIGKGVTPPRSLQSIAPDIKLTDGEKKYVGDIYLGLIVNKQGIPQKVHIIRCTHQDVCQRAMEAVSKYRFRPATYQSRPVAVDLFLEINIDTF